MSDLVCLVADKSMAAAIESLLGRFEALDIRAISTEILIHPHRDPGCFLHPAALLDGYRRAAVHALVVLDRAWSGAPIGSVRRDRAATRAALGGDGTRMGGRNRHRSGARDLGVQRLAACRQGTWLGETTATSAPGAGVTGLLAGWTSQAARSQGSVRLGPPDSAEAGVILDLPATRQAGEFASLRGSVIPASPTPPSGLVPCASRRGSVIDEARSFFIHRIRTATSHPPPP